MKAMKSRAVRGAAAEAARELKAFAELRARIEPRSRKPNAVLVWKGRKLMCNGIQVAEIGPSSVRKGQWYRSVVQEVDGWSKTDALARRAVNRRFGLPAEYGVSKP